MSPAPSPRSQPGGAAGPDPGDPDGDPAVDTGATAARQWTRVDPRSIPVEAIPWLIQTFVGYVLFTGSFPSFFWAGIDTAVFTRVAIAVGGWGVVRAIVRWATSYYLLEPRRLRFRTGLFLRRTVCVDRGLIRNVGLRCNAIAQVLGVMTIDAGTAQHERDVSVRIRSIPAADARALRDRLLPTPDEAGGPEPLMLVKPRWSLFAPFSSVSVSLWAGTYVLIYNLFFAWFAWARTWFWLIRNDVPLEYALRALVLVPIATGIIGAILLHLETWWHGRLTRYPSGVLRMSSGLLIRREVSFRENRVIGAEYIQPLILRWARRVRVEAVTTGAGSQRTLQLKLPQARRRTLMPLGPAAVGRSTLTRMVRGNVDLDELERHPRAALWQRIRWAVGAALVAIAAVRLLLQEYAPESIGYTWFGRGFPAVALVIAVLLALDNYDALGHRVTARHLICRWGTVERRTSVIDHDAIVGWVFRQTWFQWRLGLVTLHASTAAGSGAYYVRSAGVGQGTGIADEITPTLMAPFWRGADRRSSGDHSDLSPGERLLVERPWIQRA